MSGTTGRRKHSPAVYRQRRLVLLLGLIAVAVAIWLLIAQPWRGAAAENTSTPPAATQDAASELPVPDTAAGSIVAPSAVANPNASPTAETLPEASVTPTAATCIASDITVDALTDQDTYGSGQNPQLSIRLTNTGESDCSMNVGTTTQVFTITSGSDTWWRSTDCQSEPSDMVVLLAAGQTVTSAAPLTWDRTRSSVDSCAPDASRPAAPGGGATYRLEVEIGGIRSIEAKQILLY